MVDGSVNIRESLNRDYQLELRVRTEDLSADIYWYRQKLLLREHDLFDFLPTSNSNPATKNTIAVYKQVEHVC